MNPFRSTDCWWRESKVALREASSGRANHAARDDMALGPRKSARYPVMTTRTPHAAKDIFPVVLFRKYRAP